MYSVHTAKRMRSHAAQNTSKHGLSDRILNASSMHLGVFTPVLTVQ